ncbi:hypothetical protein BDV96DRAFT_649482 [Lophiotrema nucula]|uniref:Uncharacterized protein n=1 Tax=Lophiotrema nucula TaxID=690887 RepID=A0A6A5YY42_9PLEO|nr:hypothetical protein BDV96DRAFT_649482 [Lophiotrema nucula]
MSPNYKTSLGFIALLPLISSFASAETDPADSLLSVSFYGNGCHHLNDTNFDITGSAEIGSNNAFRGTWRTGLTATSGPKANVTQAFWIDTTGRDELNTTRLQDGCVHIYDNINRADWSKASNDNGDCSSLLGGPCLKAMNDAISNNILDPHSACDDLSIEMPKECTVLQGSGGDRRGFSSMFGPYKGDNGTCSTQQNEKGDKATFMTIFSQDSNSYADYANYDAMAQKPYVLINHNRFETKSGDSITPEMTVYNTDIVCMRNKDFAKDARVPDGMKPNTTPSGGAPAPTGSDKPGAASTLSASGWGLTGALAAMVFLS